MKKYLELELDEQTNQKLTALAGKYNVSIKELTESYFKGLTADEFCTQEDWLGAWFQSRDFVWLYQDTLLSKLYRNNIDPKEFLDAQNKDDILSTIKMTKEEADAQLPALKEWIKENDMLDLSPTLQDIHSRKSIRRYSDKDVSDEEIHTILKAGMAGPTAINARDWQFIIIKDKEKLIQAAEGNGRAADPLKRANFGILVCADYGKAFQDAKEYTFTNCSIASENMILAAKALGIGSVWIGTWPQKEKMDAQRKVFQLPDNIIPHSLIAFGYPAEDPDRSAKPEFEEEKVHINKW